ncbi:TPA: sugar kinase [Candidatus Gastranaerophilales bacterium HUM_20]|nr:pfkB domain protein [Clostridium sp. CAG:729]DAB20209.1 MAG TPA: sugar kinase [Candidatus Gastranaerophilales bacterium HUM_20]
MKLDIITIGESLIELSTNAKMSQAGCLYKYYGGDAIATAIAALRMGSKVGFVTRVGNDAFKDYLLDSWQAEGLDISQVKLTDEPNGMYIVARPSIQEKEVVYYRKKIASSKLSLEDIDIEYLKKANVVYASGVTQSLSPSANEAVETTFRLAKENGITTAYDPNYYSAISTPEEARESFNRISSYIDILFMSTKHDTINILDIDSPENIIKKLWDMGISTIVLKASDKNGYYTGYNGNIVFTEFYTNDVIDTTCSGDTFNGGFLHALTHGFTPFEAAKFASIVAGLQAKGIGAIKSIPYKDEVYSIYRGNNG